MQNARGARVHLLPEAVALDQVSSLNSRSHCAWRPFEQLVGRYDAGNSTRKLKIGPPADRRGSVKEPLLRTLRVETKVRPRRMFERH